MAAKMSVAADQFFDEETEQLDVYGDMTFFRDEDTVKSLRARLAEALTVARDSRPIHISPDPRQEAWEAQSALRSIYHLADALEPVVAELQGYREKFGDVSGIPRTDTDGLLDAIHELKEQQDQLRAKQDQLHSTALETQERVTKIDHQTEIKPLDLLSVGLAAYLEKKRPDLMRNGREGKYTKHTVPNAVNSFIAVAGDKPANMYKASDFENYMTFLARVPVNWNKLRDFKGCTIVEAAEKNARLRTRHPTLAGATIIRSYMTPLRGCIETMCKDEERSPFERVRISAPKNAPKSIKRNPLSLPKVNELFAVAADQRRADDRWLPILGYLTGARIGELVTLQRKDVKLVSEKWSPREIALMDDDKKPKGDAWLLDLTTPLYVDGKYVPRQLKNQGSSRLIALHPILAELGFIEWSRGQRGFLFPELHETQDPADTASKRMVRLFEKAGIRSGEKGQDIFHALRHTSKDWMRSCGLAERLIDRNAGHRPESEGGKYGAESLTAFEITLLAGVALPQHLDLSGYRERAAKRDS